MKRAVMKQNGLAKEMLVWGIWQYRVRETGNEVVKNLISTQSEIAK